MSEINTLFSLGNFYLFCFKYDGKRYTDIVEKPTSITEDEILFHFMLGHKSEAEYVKKKDILAVGNPTSGIIEIVGWTGKYTVLNKELFNHFIKEKVITIKK